MATFKEAPLNSAPQLVPAPVPETSSLEALGRIGRREWLKGLAIFAGLAGALFLVRRLWPRARPATPFNATPETAASTIDMLSSAGSFGRSYPLLATSPKQREVPRFLPQAEPAADRVALPPDAAVELNTATERFVEEVVAEPFTARAFLAQLALPARRLLLSCYQAGALRQTLEAMMDAPLDGQAAIGDEATPSAKVNQLTALTSELQQFRRLMRHQNQQPFGFLTLMSATEVLQIFAGEPTEDRGLALSHLPRQLAVEVLGLMPEAEKRALFAAISQRTASDQGQMLACEQRLRTKSELLSPNVFVPRLASASLLDLLVDAAKDPQSLLGGLIERDELLLQQFGHYLITFNDLLQDTAEQLTACMDELSNETMALAIVGCSDSQSATTLLTAVLEPRRTAVAALVSSLSRVSTQDQIVQAQGQLLANYRQLVRSAEREVR